MQSVLINNFTCFSFIVVQLNTPFVIQVPVPDTVLLSNYCGIKLSELSRVLTWNIYMSEESIVLYPNFSAIEQHCNCSARSFETRFPISIELQILDWRRDKWYRGLSFGKHESESQKETWEINAKRNVEGMERQKYENNSDDLNLL